MTWFDKIFRSLSHFKYMTSVIKITQAFTLQRDIYSQVRIFLRIRMSLIFSFSVGKTFLEIKCIFHQQILLDTMLQSNSEWTKSAEISFCLIFFQTGLSQQSAYKNISTPILKIPSIYYFNLLYRHQSNTQLE